MTDLGKIGILPRGKWIVGTIHEFNDIVSHNGSSYLALKDNAVEPSDDGINWMLIAKGTELAKEEIEQTVNDVVTQRASEDIATKDEIINDNLLKNSNFKLNTNGLSEYTGVDTYTVDKWRQFIDLDGSVMTSDNGIILDNTNGAVTLGHFLENSSAFAGKTVTLSTRILQLSDETPDGSIYIGGNDTPLADILISDKLVKDEWVTLSVTYTLPDELTNFCAVFYLGTKTQGQILINWVKLELGSIATEYVEPDIEIEKVRCGVYDADKLDGYHASDMDRVVKSANYIYKEGTDIHSYMDAGTYYLSSSAWAKTELNFPVNNLGGWFEVIGRGNIRTIIYYGFGGTSNHVRVFYKHWYKDSSTGEEFWSDWDEKLSCLTGGTLLNHLSIQQATPILQFISTNSLRNAKVSVTTGGQLVLQNINAEDTANNFTTLWLHGETRDLSSILTLSRKLNGIATNYNMLHTGNSNPIIQATSAPTDTTALWYDTNTSKLKSYKDGAWQ